MWDGVTPVPSFQTSCVRAMAKNLRRAAKKAMNARGSHGLLGLFIFDEKLVCESYKKLVDSKANSTLSMLKWARNEENKAINDVFSKVFEVTSMWTTVWANFLDEYQKYRSTFKELLREERDLAEVVKHEAACAAKLSRLQKQMQQVSNRSSKVVTTQMAEVIMQAEKARAELEVKQTKHEILKARKLRASLHGVADGLQKWAEQTSSVSSAYRNLAKLIPDTPTQFTKENVYPGAGQGRAILSKLSAELEIKPEVSAQLAAVAGHGAQNAYLYAMSPLLKANHSQSDFHDTVPPTANGDDIKPRKPQPLPKTKPTQEARQARNKHLSRPVSAGEMMLPHPSSSQGGSLAVPAQQPGGKLWYARTKLLELRESDSEDSDGYTEPLPYMTHSISDSALSRLEAVPVESNDSEQPYQQLSQIQKQDINKNPAYVDLLG